MARRIPWMVLASLGLLASWGSGCAHAQKIESLQSQLDACDGEHRACTEALGACESDLDAAARALSLADRRMAAYRAIAEKLRAAFGDLDLEILIRNGRLVVQLPNKILFDFGRHELRPEGAEVVERLAGVLATVSDRQFLIAGHTDNVPVKERSASYKTNWELSTLRALAVVYALEGSGVAPTQLGAAGYGEHFPDAANDTDEGRQQNRRTEIIIMPTIDEIPELPKRL